MGWDGFEEAGLFSKYKRSQFIELTSVIKQDYELKWMKSGAELVHHHGQKETDLCVIMDP